MDSQEKWLKDIKNQLIDSKKAEMEKDSKIQQMISMNDFYINDKFDQLGLMNQNLQKIIEDLKVENQQLKLDNTEIKKTLQANYDHLQKTVENLKKNSISNKSEFHSDQHDLVNVRNKIESIFKKYELKIKDLSEEINTRVMNVLVNERNEKIRDQNKFEILLKQIESGEDCFDGRSGF